MADLRRTADRQSADLARLLEPPPLLDLLPDPVLILDPGRSPLRSNQAARRIFGEDMQAVMRHPVLRTAISQTFQTSTPQTADLTLPGPLTRELRVHVRLIDPPLADSGRLLLVLSDRTQERAAERGRTDFIANASHELRTPLASLIGFIETLQGPAADDPATHPRFLTIMADQARRMQRLVEDLLALSRIEMNERHPPQELVDITALVKQATAGFEPQLTAQNVTLELEIPPDPVLIPADADQLSQILQNLLDNALKYGGDGERLQVRLSSPGSRSPEAAASDGVNRDPKRGPGEKWPVRAGVVLTVTDYGKGIAPEHLPRLSERFYRVDKSRSRAVGGTGLGLAIVKHIVNRHRGQLVIQSEPGVGTTIRVWLPAAQAHGIQGGPSAQIGASSAP